MLGRPVSIARPLDGPIPITFTSDDSEAVKFPHFDTLVISASIAKVDVQRALVNGCSFTDLLFKHAFD